MKRTRRGILWSLIALVGIYGGLLIWFRANESSLLYLPERQLQTTPEEFGIAYGRVEIPSTDSVRLVCWLLPSSDTSTVWLLYLHGNSGNIAKRGYVEHYAELRKLGLNILAVEYRGFGESSGSPSEQGLYDDALAGFEYLRTKQHVPAERIIIYGYSLGSAVAADLAAKVPAGGLIVEGSFPSISDVGQDHYPYIPVRLIVRQHFDAGERLRTTTIPKLFIHARDDHTIPISYGRALFEMAREPKTFLEVSGGHENARTADPKLFYSGIRLFVMQVNSHLRQPGSAH
jgi:fermentation-respiration switch protein FrsA (DUF1100 family)